jgi:hypothetical protein
MAFHTTSNWLGEPTRVALDPEPDIEYEHWRDEIEIQDALDAQLKLVPRAEQGAQIKGAA